MSVILFTSRSQVFSTLAQNYEGLKPLASRYARRTFSEKDDYDFYKALRRLYFANVACYLCQYHDDTPLTPDELQAIETFDHFDTAQANPDTPHEEQLKAFLGAWRSLKYNLCTNDGEVYKAVGSFEYIEDLVQCYRRALLISLLNAEATGLRGCLVHFAQAAAHEERG